MDEQVLTPPEAPAEVAPESDAGADVSEAPVIVDAPVAEAPAPVLGGDTAPEPEVTPEVVPEPVAPSEPPAPAEGPVQEAAIDPFDATRPVPVEAVPTPEPVPPSDLDAPITDVYTSFDDSQREAILAAGLEVAQARQEMGLALINREPAISINEAIARALPKYLKAV